MASVPENSYDSFAQLLLGVLFLDDPSMINSKNVFMNRYPPIHSCTSCEFPYPVGVLAKHARVKCTSTVDLGDQMPDPARWLNDNIPGWRDLQNKEKKAIRDFAVLWSFFELNATSRYGRPNANPQNIVRAVDDLEQVPDLDRIDVARAFFAGRYIDGDGFSEPWYHLYVLDAFAVRVRSGLISEGRTSRGTFLALLLITNRLRNNFMHGEKARYDFAGQYDNFTQANSILMYALELWPNPHEG